MTTAQLLDAARTLLADGQRSQAAACLQAVQRLEPGNLDAQNLLEEHRLDGALGHAFGLEGRIHPDDDIFRFFASHPSSTNPVRDYLADGWRTLAELRELHERLDRKLGATPRFLEFASGHGRFTRHLVKALPPGSLAVSDILPGSTEFLCQTFGVRGFPSCAEPEDLDTQGEYDTIFVLSLFSHLPDGLWQRWLARLHRALAPGGMLIITTHGEFCANLVGLELPPEGYHFIGSSESSLLDPSLYGNTFTSPAYVRAAIDGLAEKPARVEHVPALFWSRQDAWVIQRR
ncbi:SAM-dependent methyltransferase [Thauera butanivorans]|uniref:SAM-dependent methyltransferase n=1 Tax=Thauera butanivorans TaxID=86174 RepID=UPI003AB29800